MIKAFNDMDNNKKIPLVIGIAVILIIIIILFSYFRKNNSDYKGLKEDVNKALVYTINSEENGIYFIKVPYLNINSSIGKEINEDIESFIEDFSDDEKLMLSYQYNINGKILSLVIKCVDYNAKYIPKAYFKTYNINLEEQKLLSDEELLAIYNIDSNKVSNFIENKFTYWYKDIIKNGYFAEEECDYLCFLEYREVDNYLDDVVYYIEQGNLVAYKPFVFYSIFGEENYFKEKDFKFEITKKES